MKSPLLGTSLEQCGHFHKCHRRVVVLVAVEFRSIFHTFNLSGYVSFIQEKRKILSDVVILLFLI
jgi:hypothetical protein